jgi:hypothetical protein
MIGPLFFSRMEKHRYLIRLRIYSSQVCTELHP